MNENINQNEQIQIYEQQQDSDDGDSDDELISTVLIVLNHIKRRTALLTFSLATEFGNIGRPRRFLKFSTHWTDLDSMPETEFIKRMRMDRETFTTILEDIRSLIEVPVEPGNNLPDPIPAEIRFAICIKFLATGDSIVTLSDLFAVGRSTVYQIIKDVVDALVTVYNNSSTFPFPNCLADYQRIAQGFFLKSQFPFTIGALDGTHIPICKPSLDPASYRNYKGFESLHIMTMCDHKTKILYHNVGMPGKNHDSYVFKRSTLPDKLKSIPIQYHAIADPAYPLMLQLLKRYPGEALPISHEHYNYRQSRCRMIIESFYGRLKGRFRCLLKPLGFYDLEFVCNIIVACLCLHNILVEKNDDNYPGMCEDEEYKNLMRTYHVSSRDAPLLRGRAERKAKEKRDMIRNLLNNEMSEEQCIRILNIIE